MTFEQSDSQLGGGLYFKLEDHGDSETVMFVGEPMPKATQFKGKKRTVFVFPIVTLDGLQVWTAGAKVYKHIRDNWGDFNGSAVKVTRNGKTGDKNTTYSFTKAKISKGLEKTYEPITLENIVEIVDSAVSYESQEE